MSLLLLLLLCPALLTWTQVSILASGDQTPAPSPSPSSLEDDRYKLKIGYWPSYSSDKFPLKALNASFYTHLYYAFASVNDETFQVEIPITSQLSAALFSPTIKQHNPDVKTLLSIGGASSSSTVFSQMASSNVSRQAFINSSIHLAELYRLGVSKIPRLLLTAAVYYSPAVPDNQIPGLRYTYPVHSMAASVDWVNIMCFDYHGAWQGSMYTTGEHAALEDPTSNLSSSYGIEKWLEEGLPSSKAVMGLAMYGRTWLLANLSETGVGAPAKGPGPPQNRSNETGIIFYVEVDELVRTKNLSVVDDVETGSAYTFLDNLWIGYDNEVSIGGKVEYLLSKEMRGYFFWTASFDSNSKLAIAASETLDNSVVPVPVPVPPSPPMDNRAEDWIRVSYGLYFLIVIALL